MGKLSTATRARLKSSDFAGPGRSFPITDPNHARAAIIDTGRAVKAGHITNSQAAKIKERARSYLSKHK